MRKFGHSIEQHVQKYLESKGLIPVDANFTCKMGEIDLIMKDNSSLVFIEVRYRSKSQFGTGIESISTSKIRKIVKSANFYLQKHHLYDKVSCRFDVVSVSSHSGALGCEWVKDAFYADHC